MCVFRCVHRCVNAASCICIPKCVPRYIRVHVCVGTGVSEFRCECAVVSSGVSVNTEVHEDTGESVCGHACVQTYLQVLCFAPPQGGRRRHPITQMRKLRAGEGGDFPRDTRLSPLRASLRGRNSGKGGWNEALQTQPVFMAGASGGT